MGGVWVLKRTIAEEKEEEKEEKEKEKENPMLEEEITWYSACVHYFIYNIILLYFILKKQKT